MKIFSFVGWSRSGKTTLISKIIKKLKDNGKKIIAIKNIPFKYHLEPESKDSFMFLEAGSDDVMLVAENEILNMRKIRSRDEVFEILITKYSDYDFVLLEGLRKRDIPAIEVFYSAREKGTKFPVERLTAVVSDQRVTEEIPCFDTNDIDGIIKFMESYDESSHFKD